MHSKVQVELPSFGKITRLVHCLSERLLVLLLPTNCVQTLGMLWRLPKSRLSKWTFLVALGRRYSIRTPKGRTISAMIDFSGQARLRSWKHKQHFRSSRQSSTQVAFLVWVVSMLTRKHHWALFLPNQRYLAVLTWRWWHFCSEQFAKGTKLFSHPGKQFL